MIDVKITDNTDLVKNALAEQIEQALIAVGMEAESNAKKELSRAVYNAPEAKSGYVRTGRLWNSITYALAGKEAHISEYTDNNNNVFSVDGTAPNVGGKERSVYVGTNVEYAKYVEGGTMKMPARPYLRPAIVNHVDEYKSLVEAALSK